MKAQQANKEHETEMQELHKAYRKEIQDAQESHRKQLEVAANRIKDLEKELLVSETKVDVLTEARPTNQTNFINVTLSEFTPEVGVLLANKITKKEFWDGQKGIAHTLRDLRNPDGNPFYWVKDENRFKYEIMQGGQKIRDDTAERIIKSVEKPVREKIGIIRNTLVEGAEPGYAVEVLDQARKCMNFSDDKKNGEFLRSLSSKNS